MADQQQTQDQQRQQSEQYGGPERRTQESIDSAFASQVAGGDPFGSVQWQREYFRLATETLDTARRVSEMQALTQIKAQLVAEVRHQVMAEIRRDPTVIQ
jgi:hypothetical protein